MSSVTTITYTSAYMNETFHTILTFVDGSVPLDVSGGTFKMSIVASGADTPAVTVESGDGIEFVTDGTDGKIEITIAQAVVEALTAGKYAFDLIKTEGGVIDVMARGSIKFVPGITDPA